MTFIWCCAKSACNADGVEFDVSLELFADLLEPEDVLEFGRDEFDVQKKTKLTAPVVVKEGEQSTRTEG